MPPGGALGLRHSIRNDCDRASNAMVVPTPIIPAQKESKVMRQAVQDLGARSYLEVCLIGKPKDL